MLIRLTAACHLYWGGGTHLTLCPCLMQAMYNLEQYSPSLSKQMLMVRTYSHFEEIMGTCVQESLSYRSPEGYSLNFNYLRHSQGICLLIWHRFCWCLGCYFFFSNSSKNTFQSYTKPKWYFIECLAAEFIVETKIEWFTN